MTEPSASSIEGRALAARPSACLTLAGAICALAFLFTGSAVAAPKAPALNGTNPPSPGAALRPFIMGDPEGGVVISGLPRQMASGLGVSGRDTENPNFEVIIYTEDPTCSESDHVAATGTAAELVEPGIQIDDDVVPGSETLFYAKQIDPSDPAHPSECSNGLRYRHVTGPPDPPVLEGTDPSSPAGDNFPNVIGSAPVQTTVLIFDNPSCAGAAVATGTVTTFENQGIEVTVADNSTTSFYARARIAEYNSACSTSSVTYQEVSEVEPPGGGGGPGGGGEPPAGENPPSGGGGPGGGTGLPDPRGKPPAPSLRTVPGYSANDNTPMVTGKAPGAAKVLIYGSAGCKGPVLAQGSAPEFTGPGLPVQVADDTTVTLYGVSVDGGDDRSACSEQPAIYVEDSTAPHTRITSGPAAKTRKRKAVFRFADVAGDTSVNFFCKLDNAKWKACRAPLKLKGLKRKRHVLRVKGTDAAGNAEQGVAKRAFRVVRAY